MYNCDPICHVCQNTAQVSSSISSYRDAVLKLLCEIAAIEPVTFNFLNTNSIEFQTLLTDISANFRISSNPGNQLSIQVDGLYVPEPTANATLVEDFIFTTTNWNKPANAKSVEVHIFAGGGGGAGGGIATLPNGPTRFGGAGGAHTDQFFNGANLPDTVLVTIGTGGAGGASSTGAAGLGTDGLSGNNTTFGNYLTAHGGAANTSSGISTSSLYVNGAFFTGGGNGTSAANTAQGVDPRGGGGGGRINASVALSGTTGNGYSMPSLSGGAGGAAGINGTIGNNKPAEFAVLHGTGGGGGGASTTGNSGKGGDGGVPGGGGGSGGSVVALSGFSTGGGGTGGNGMAYIRTWCSI